MDVRASRALFPALERQVYLNTAAVGLGSTLLHQAYREFTAQWLDTGLDFVRAEKAADRSRELFAHLIGASARDVALVASVSAAAGLVAGQFTQAGPGENLVIGAQEYSSNHFPWRQLAQRGYAEVAWTLVAYHWGIDRLLDFLNSGGTWQDLPEPRRRYAEEILRIAQTLP